MAITLEEAKVGMADKVVQTVIDEFRRGSLLMDKLIYDDAVSPGTGGSTLTYGYTKVKTPSTASFREINGEYTPNEAKREKASVDLKILGGNFKIDRVLARSTQKAIDEVNFQMQEKIKGAINLFHYTVINGDSNGTDEFDGLDKLLLGSDTEYNNNVAEYIDLSTSEMLDKNSQAFIDALDDFLAGLDGKPTMLMGNSKLITKIKSVARRAGYLTNNEDSFGKKIDGYDNIPLVDLENYVSVEADVVTTVPCVTIETRNTGEADISGLTDLYAVVIDINGFHGVTLTGNNIISTNMPNLNGAGTIKEGDVEMVAAVALKNSRKAGVFRNIKVK
ncbi:MAG: major capsid protein [Clostridium sp.]